jgi:hypothetical protein
MSLIVIVPSKIFLRKYSGEFLSCEDAITLVALGFDFYLRKNFILLYNLNKKKK